MSLIITKSCIVEAHAGEFGVIWGFKETFTPLINFSWNVTFEIIKENQN